jgi:hypothetical protein
MDKDCKNVLTLKQYGKTCWFNSILMAILFSDESRKLLLAKSKKWNPKIEVLKTINFILNHKYFRSKNIHDDYAYFDKITPEHILAELHKHNAKKFMFDPIKYKGFGFLSSLYIRKVYKFLGVKVLYVDKIGDDIYYSAYNNNYKIEVNGKYLTPISKMVSSSKIREKLYKPDVIIVRILDNYDKTRYPESYKLSGIEPKFNMNLFKKKGIKIDDLKKLEDVFVYDNDDYIRDSVIINSWNKPESGNMKHSICGITCNGSKYVYNGVPTESIPCELMKYDWDTNIDTSFYLSIDKSTYPYLNKNIYGNMDKCTIDVDNVEFWCSEINCFSFGKGDRLVIYVKKNKTNKLYVEGTSIKSDKPGILGKIRKMKDVAKKMFKRVLNPLTNRFVKLETLNKLSKKQLSISESPELHETQSEQLRISASPRASEGTRASVSPRASEGTRASASPRVSSKSLSSKSSSSPRVSSKSLSSKSTSSSKKSSKSESPSIKITANGN